MTISLPKRRISIFSLSKGLLVVANKVDGIIGVLNVIPFILFRSIPGLTNKIFSRATLTLFHYLFIKQTVYLAGFGNISITVIKHGGGYVR